MLNQTLNNRYKITARLGKGAMGEVYLATDRQMKQEVALKIITGDLALNKEMLARFRREGESLRQLRHRNIVAFWEMFDDRDQQIIVMEYVPGGNLHDLIQRGPLPVGQAVQIALELADALAQAHHIHIIHRDIKPENVLMADGVTPKLTDFGVARLLSDKGRLTGTGALVGTPYYMSPEAWQGKALTAQADVWSLGVVLYEMVTGQVPFPGDTLPAVMSKVLMESPPDLRVLSPELPESLVRIIERALTRDPAERYRTMRQLAVDLEAVETEPKPAPDDTRRKTEGAQIVGMATQGTDEMRFKTEAERKAGTVPLPRDETRRKAEGSQKTSVAVPAQAARPRTAARASATVKEEPLAAAPPGAFPWRRLALAALVALAIMCLLATGGLGLWKVIDMLWPTATPTAPPTATTLPLVTASFTSEPPSLTPEPPTATLTPEPPTATLTPEPPTATLTPEPPTAAPTPEPPTATPMPPTRTRALPTATSIPPTAAPTAIAGDRGLRLTGRIVWNNLPVPGARAVLKEMGDYYQMPVLAEATAGADGRFVLESPPAGHFALYFVAPSDEYMGWRGTDVTIGVGQAKDVGTYSLAKKLQLLEPPDRSTVTTTTPALRWASFPGAVRYHVDVFSQVTHQAVMRQDTADTSVVVAPPLAAGVMYQWSVSAFNAAGDEFAYYSAWTFTVQP